MRRGAILVHHGKGGKRREVGMDDWPWEHVEPWRLIRRELPVGPFLCVIEGATCGRAWSQKSAAGRRRVPIAGVLRDYLVRHRLSHPKAERVFGRADDTPFSPSTIAQRTERAWSERASER